MQKGIQPDFFFQQFFFQNLSPDHFPLLHDEIHRNSVPAEGLSEGLIELYFLLFELFLVNIFQSLQLLEDIL